MTPKNGQQAGKTREEQDDWLTWRAEHTTILKQQTEILRAFREDFKRHDEEEVKFREDWIMAGTRRDAQLEQLKADHNTFRLELKTLRDTDLTVIKATTDGLNRRVWINLGAVGVYAPIILYLAVKLIEHLIGR